MRLRPYQFRTLLGGLLLLAVLAASYGLPVSGSFFPHLHSAPYSGGQPRDIPHEGVTHRHAGGGEPESFFRQDSGETHRNGDSGHPSPDDGHQPDGDFFWQDGSHPNGHGGEGTGPAGGASHGGGDGRQGHGGFGGADGRGAGGYYPPGKTGAPEGQDGAPAPRTQQDSPGDNPFDDPSSQPPADPPPPELPPVFDAGCSSCDLTLPAGDFPQDDPPSPGDLPKRSGAAPVPEPSSLLLLASALLAFAAMRARLAPGRGGV